MKLALIAGAALIAFAGASQAATTTSSATTGMQQTDFASTAIPGLSLVPALELDLFDPSLGTLTGVSLTIEASFDAMGTIENTGTTALSGFEQGVQVNANTSIGGLSLTVDLVDGLAPTTFAGGQIETVDLDDSGSASGTSADLGAFTGPGTFVVDFFTLSNSTIIGGGNLIALIETDAEIIATVEYTFDDGGVTPPQIPLPASAPLLLAALGGLGFLSSRRRKG